MNLFEASRGKIDCLDWDMTDSLLDMAKSNSSPVKEISLLKEFLGILLEG
jgi:hypothetical protein